MASPQKDQMLEEMQRLREKWSNRAVVLQDETLVIEGQQTDLMDEEILSIDANNNENTQTGLQHQAPAIDNPEPNPLKNVILGVDINKKLSWISFAPKTPFVATQSGQFFSSENADDWQFENIDLTPEDKSKVVGRINQTLRASYQELAGGKYNVQEIMGPNGQLTFQFTHRDGSALKPAEERELSKDIERKMPDVFNRHAASKDDNIKLRMMAAPASREVKSAIRAPAPRPGAAGYKSAKDIEEEQRRFAFR